jgi:predicted metal-dependent hydrolase
MHRLLRYTLDLFESLAAPPADIATVRDTPSKNANSPYSHIASEKPLGSVQEADFVHPKATRSLRLNGVQVAFSLVRARRSSIGMTIGPDGLSVRAPRWISLHAIDLALQERAAWIVRKLQESRTRNTQLQQTRIDWRDGAVFPYLGGLLRLHLDPTHQFAAAGADLSEDLQSHGGQMVRILRIALPSDASAAQIRDATQAWLMRQARSLFEARLNHFAPLLRVQWKKLSLSNAGTRWGSARADGAIRLHWRLVHLSLAEIDYVVAHELSHLRVMNHSPQFWDTVRSVMPDYAQRRQRLKQESLADW